MAINIKANLFTLIYIYIYLAIRSENGYVSSFARGTLITLSEDSKSVNLVYEIEHAGPPSEPESDNQYPNNHKDIHGVCACPTSKK